MIVGLVGRLEDPHGNTSSMGAGKSTVARVLCEQFGFCELGLADPLKRFCMDVFDMSEEQLWGPSEMRSTPTDTGVVPREALRTLGTEWGRALDPDVWIRYAVRIHRTLRTGICFYDRALGLLEKGAFEPKPEHSRVVISDVRFLNELEHLSRIDDAKLVLVRRPVSYAIEPSTHQSEVDLDGVVYPWDLVIENDGALSDLRARTVAEFAALFE